MLADHLPHQLVPLHDMIRDPYESLFRMELPVEYEEGVLSPFEDPDFNLGLDDFHKMVDPMFRGLGRPFSWHRRGLRSDLLLPSILLGMLLLLVQGFLGVPLWPALVVSVLAGHLWLFRKVRSLLYLSVEKGSRLTFTSLNPYRPFTNPHNNVVHLHVAIRDRQTGEVCKWIGIGFNLPMQDSALNRALKAERDAEEAAK